MKRPLDQLMPEGFRWGPFLRRLALGLALAGSFGLAPMAFAEESGDAEAIEDSQTGQVAEEAADTAAAGNASQSLLDPGQVVITGFSSSMLSDSETAAENDQTKVDETFINVDGAVARVVDVSGVAPGDAVRDNPSAAAFEVTARDIGQVFGITLDRATNPQTGRPAPNIYLAATSAYGLHIVVPDRDGDGWPERVTTGDPEADWMEGLFGTTKGGGPGTIWKIDGVTGEISKFADISDKGEPNSGAGLGNLSYDAEHDLIYVSDLDTGYIYRLNMQGEMLDRFDHGVAGREVEGMPTFEDDPNDRADITSPQFKSDDPTTWGYAQPPRRVWGVKAFGGRLYYAVAEGPEIWSIALGADGEFDAPRRELALPSDIEPYEIADISFTSDGVMILAQRPPVTGSYDYVTTVATGPARVLRYKPGPSDEERWVPVPEEYAIGERGEHRNTSGGVALGYAFKEEGGLDYDRCEQTLWTTGESLLQEATRAIKVEKVPGFATSAVDGLQGNGIDEVRPEYEPPKDARYVDYDGTYVDNGSRGHLGDVEVPYNCGGDAAEPWRPEYEVAYWDEEDGEGRVYPELDLYVEKRAVGTCKPGGLCRWEVTLANLGDAVYYGPAVLTDTLSTSAMTLISAGPSPWGCAQYGATLNCHRPAIYLKPGRHLTVSLTFRLASSYDKPTVRNCARTNWLAGAESKDVVRAVQMELALRGYYAGEVDGVAGPQTVDAIESFEADAGLTVSGEVSRELVLALFGKGAWRAGDADPGNDEGCAEHAVDGAYKPKKIYEPKLVSAAPYIPPVYYPKPFLCEPGYFKRGGECIRICPPGTYRDGNRCIYEEPVVLVCRGGKVPTPDGDCVCPVGAREEFNGYRTRCVWPERIRCYGGRVVDGDCYCPEGTESVKTGRRSYLCMPIRDTVCIDGVWRGGRCDCPLNRYLVKLDRDTYQCVRRSREPVCFGGFADEGRCYCPDHTDPVRLAPGVFQCARKDNDRLTCIGGYADHGDCYCYRDNYRPVKLSRHVYECRRQGGYGDDLTCIGGRNVGGSCDCRGDDKLVKLSSRIFRCEGGGTGITCRGGDVVGGKCRCPSGTTRYAVGDRSYVCTKTGGTNVKCIDGDIRDGKCICSGNDVRSQIGPNAYRCRPPDVTTAVTCRGGTVNGRFCTCPKGSRAVVYAKNAYNCVNRDGDSVGGNRSDGGSTAPKKLTCINGKIANGKCVCAKGATLDQTGSLTYRCLPKASGGSDGDGDTAKVVCRGGTVNGRFCTCPQGGRPVVVAKNVYQCQTKDGSAVDQGGNAAGGDTGKAIPKIVCVGGTVEAGACSCPNNTTRQKLGANRFRCLPKQGGDNAQEQAQKIVCKGGIVQGKRCVCGAGKQVEQAGDNAYRCVAKGGSNSNGQGQGQNEGGKDSGSNKVVCQGGTVAGGACVCGQGKKLQPLGGRKFRCVAGQQDDAQQKKKQQQDQQQKKKQQQQQQDQQQQLEKLQQKAKKKQQQQQLDQQQKGDQLQQQQDAKQQLKKLQQQQKKLQQQQKKQQEGGNANKAKAKSGALRCIGGSVVGNSCQCGPGKKMVQAGANVFRCVKDN